MSESQHNEEMQKIERAVRWALSFFTLEQVRQLVREMEDQTHSGRSHWTAATERNRRRPVMRRHRGDMRRYRNN